MELLIKPYSGQPARIGIRYIYEFQAVKAYEELLKATGSTPLTGILEAEKGLFSLSLTSGFNGKTVRYKSLEFRHRDLQQLERLLPPYLFVHVFPQHNRLLVAKPFRQARFLTISHLEVRVG